MLHDENVVAVLRLVFTIVILFAYLRSCGWPLFVLNLFLLAFSIATPEIDDRMLARGGHRHDLMPRFFHVSFDLKARHFRLLEGFSQGELGIIKHVQGLVLLSSQFESACSLLHAIFIITVEIQGFRVTQVDRRVQVRFVNIMSLELVSHETGRGVALTQSLGRCSLGKDSLIDLAITPPFRVHKRIQRFSPR